MEVTAKSLHDFLYEGKDAILVKYHYGDGFDLEQLDKFYDILEQLKADWTDEVSVPKDLMYDLISVIPVLYGALPNYNEEEIEEYTELIYKLEGAIQMCLNPDKTDPFFNKPLREG